MKSSSFIKTSNILLFLITVLFLVPSNLSSQTQEDQNLQKYWYYRWRLQNDFLKVGEGVGHSIPIQCRKGIRWVQDIEVVDATIYHGFYLGILATEYKLLSLNGRKEDAERTKTELYYAIKAYERLDLFAEEMFRLEGQINGFVARDDVPCDFIDSVANPQNYRHFNQDKTRAPGTNNVYKIQTADACFDGKPLDSLDMNDPKIVPEMSQDQVLWLLMGYMLIEKSMEPGIDSVTLLSGERIAYNFNFQAKRHSTNMINYCRFKYPDKPNKTKWRIFRPDGQKVYPGQNVFGFKYPLSIIGEKMYTPLAENPQEFTRTPGKFQWSLTKIWIPYKNVNGQMITILAAMSGKWKNSLDKTSKKIDKTWNEYNWANFYLPLMSYLHNYDISEFDVLPLVGSDLSEAPAFGPYNLSNRDIIEEYVANEGIPVYTKGWARHLKYSSHPDLQADGSKDEDTYRGFYAGLDYMLLFNLYYLTVKEELPLYQNLVDRHIDAVDVNQNNKMNPVQSFNSVIVSNADSLQRILKVQTGYVVTGEGVDIKIRQRLIEIKYEKFNPWEKQNMRTNSYGWFENFPRKIHSPF